MAFEDTPLFEEVKAIVEEGPNLVNSTWECLIITPEVIIRPLKFVSMDIERDYLNNYCDHVVIDVLIPKGAYTQEMLPFKQELLAEIKRIPIGEADEPVDEPPVVKTYRAILERESDGEIEESGADGQALRTANRQDAMRLSIQLLPIAAEQLQLMEVGGIYRNDIPGNVIRYILTYISTKLDLPEEDKIIGVDRIEWNNTKPFPHMVIPQGTKVQDAPALIQDDWGGVYNSGIGCYLQDTLWYLWPEFNTERFDIEERVLLLINVPKLSYRGIERTWRLDEYQLVALSTGETAHLDTSHHKQMNDGNAIRHTHTDQMWDNENAFGKNFGNSTKDNKFHFKRSDNSSEYVAIKRPNYNVARMSPSRLANNSFAESSRMAKRKGSFATFVWENSRPELIFPGMPLRLMYLEDHEVREVDGVVIKAHHFIHDPRTGPEQTRFISNTALSVFLNTVEEE